MANQPTHVYHRVILEGGSTVTPKINIYGNTLVGFKFPVGFDGATITLRAAIEADSPNFANVIDPVTGSEITIYAGADKFVVAHPSDLSSIQYFRIVSATIAAADREIIVITRPCL